MQFVCLMFTGRALSDAIRMELVLAARCMLRARHGKARMKDSICNGTIRTDFKTGTVGSAVGIIFEADVEHEGGKTVSRFLIDERVAFEEEKFLLDSHWIQHNPARARNAQYN